MSHRKWSSMRSDLNCIFEEHNNLYEDWKKASLEAERLAKENGDLCDAVVRMNAELKILHPGETVEGVVLERDSYRLEIERLRQDLQAVKAVPAGVPSVDELVKLYSDTYCHAKSSVEAARIKAATAIRDAVLAGIATPVWTDDQIEVLAQKLRDAHASFFGEADPNCYSLSGFRAEARTAVEFMRAVPPVPSVDPDAWKTPIDGGNSGPDLRDDTDSEGVKAILVLSAGEWVYFSPEQAAKYGSWLASYAGAHGCLVNLPAPAEPIATPETLEGLPSRDDIAKIIRGNAETIPLDAPMITKRAEAILTALRPWLHTPTGWELDVHPEEMYTAWCKCALDYGPNRMIAVLDLCRSRIRPTFECQECAKVKVERDVMYRDWDDCRNRMLKVRLALNDGDES